MHNHRQKNIPRVCGLGILGIGSGSLALVNRSIGRSSRLAKTLIPSLQASGASPTVPRGSVGRVSARGQVSMVRSPYLIQFFCRMLHSLIEGGHLVALLHVLLPIMLATLTLFNCAGGKKKKAGATPAPSTPGVSSYGCPWLSRLGSCSGRASRV